MVRQERDGVEAGIVVRRGDEAEAREEEVGSDQREEGQSSRARRGGAVQSVPVNITVSKIYRVRGGGTHKAPRATTPPAAATVKAGTT